MTAYRAEQDRLRREAGLSGPPVPLKAEPVALPPPVAPNPLAALRVSQPLGGGRVVQPRPSNVPRPQPVARPPPRQAADSSAGAGGGTSGPSDSVPSAQEGPASTTATTSSAERPESPMGLPPPTGDCASTREGEEAAGAGPPPRLPAPEPSSSLLPSPACSSYFVEPLSWMSPFLESGVLAGKIVCPNKRCGAKLGNFDWAGNRASLCFSRCPSRAS